LGDYKGRGLKAFIFKFGFLDALADYVNQYEGVCEMEDEGYFVIQFGRSPIKVILAT